MRSVLIVEADERLLGERAEQLLMDGYAIDAVSAFEAARIKLAERPDALVLCNAGTGPETIALLRQLRAGEIARADSSLPVLVVGADADSAAVRYYASAPTSRCHRTARRSSSPRGSRRSLAGSTASSAAKSCGSGA